MVIKKKNWVWLLIVIQKCKSKEYLESRKKDQKVKIMFGIINHNLTYNSKGIMSKLLKLYKAIKKNNLYEIKGNSSCLYIKIFLR